MKKTLWTLPRGLTVMMAGLVAVVVCRAAFAIPTGSMGLRTFDVHGSLIGLIDLRVERSEGPYLIDPIDVMTDEFALVWLGLPAQTYAIYAIGNTGEPFPGPPLAVVTVFDGAHDLIVNLIVPTPCPTDVDDDRTTGIADLLGLLGEWGPCLGCAADTNDDNVVDIIDFLAVLAGWGACPA